MLADNQILKELDNVDNSESLYNFLNKRIKFILPILSNVRNKIRSLSETLDFNTDIFSILYFDKAELQGYEYFLLKDYVNSIKCTSVPITTMNQILRNLYLLLCDNTKILEWNDWPASDSVDNVESATSLWQEYQKDFLHSIFDLYIPAHSSVTISDEVVNAGYGIAYMINHTDELNTTIFHESDAIKLASYVRDIYTNDEIKSNAFVDMHGLDLITYAFVNRVGEIIRRYKNYFKSTEEISADDLATDKIYLMFITFSDTTLPKPEVIGQIRDLTKYFNSIGCTNINIVKCFLKDILNAAGDLIDSYHYSEYMNLINSYADTDENKDIAIGIESLRSNESINGYTTNDGFAYAMEEYKKNSVKIHQAEGKFYKVYKNYKNNKDKVDSQLNKAIEWGKKLLVGDVKSEVIEGKRFNAMGLLRSALTTSAIFALNPVAGLISIVVQYALKKSTTISERKKISMELEEEIEMVTEKIEDARGDGDREAKYAMMRTRNELQNALRRVKYGMEADQRSLNTAKSSINALRGGGKLD